MATRASFKRAKDWDLQPPPAPPRRMTVSDPDCGPLSTKEAVAEPTAMRLARALLGKLGEIVEATCAIDDALVPTPPVAVCDGVGADDPGGLIPTLQMCLDRANEAASLAALARQKLGE